MTLKYSEWGWRWQVEWELTCNLKIRILSGQKWTFYPQGCLKRPERFSNSKYSIRIRFLKNKSKKAFRFEFQRNQTKQDSWLLFSLLPTRADESRTEPLICFVCIFYESNLYRTYLKSINQSILRHRISPLLQSQLLKFVHNLYDITDF